MKARWLADEENDELGRRPTEPNLLFLSNIINKLTEWLDGMQRDTTTTLATTDFAQKPTNHNKIVSTPAHGRLISSAVLTTAQGWTELRRDVGRRYSNSLI